MSLTLLCFCYSKTKKDKMVIDPDIDTMLRSGQYMALLELRRTYGSQSQKRRLPEPYDATPQKVRRPDPPKSGKCFSAKDVFHHQDDQQYMDAEQDHVGPQCKNPKVNDSLVDTDEEQNDIYDARREQDTQKDDHESSNVASDFLQNEYKPFSQPIADQDKMDSFSKVHDDVPMEPIRQPNPDNGDKVSFENREEEPATSRACSDYVSEEQLTPDDDDDKNSIFGNIDQEAATLPVCLDYISEEPIQQPTQDNDDDDDDDKNSLFGNIDQEAATLAACSDYISEEPVQQPTQDNVDDKNSLFGNIDQEAATLAACSEENMPDKGEITERKREGKSSVCSDCVSELSISEQLQDTRKKSVDCSPSPSVNVSHQSMLDKEDEGKSENEGVEEVMSTTSSHFDPDTKKYSTSSGPTFAELMRRKSIILLRPTPIDVAFERGARQAVSSSNDMGLARDLAQGTPLETFSDFSWCVAPTLLSDSTKCLLSKTRALVVNECGEENNCLYYTLCEWLEGVRDDKARQVRSLADFYREWFAFAAPDYKNKRLLQSCNDEQEEYHNALFLRRFINEKLVEYASPFFKIFRDVLIADPQYSTEKKFKAAVKKSVSSMNMAGIEHILMFSILSSTPILVWEHFDEDHFILTMDTSHSLTKLALPDGDGQSQAKKELVRCMGHIPNPTKSVIHILFNRRIDTLAHYECLVVFDMHDSQ